MEAPSTSPPTLKAVTPSPTWSTTPATSEPRPPGRPKGITWRIQPRKTFQSIGLTPAARTVSRTRPGPAVSGGTQLTRARSDARWNCG